MVNLDGIISGCILYIIDENNIIGAFFIVNVKYLIGKIFKHMVKIDGSLHF